MLKTLRFFGLLTLSLVFWSSQQAIADPWKDESGTGRRGYSFEKKDEKYDSRKGEYKYEYKRGDCKYEYKADKHGYKEKRKCKGRAFHAGGPPPWAPAHGYRYKHGGSTAYARPFGIGLGNCNREVLGGLLGGAIGGYAGSHVGKGSGRTAAIIGGALAGVLIGGSIGRSMDQLDQHCVGQILEHAPPDQAVAWDNPDTGARYRVTPTRTYQENGGRYCREYQTVSVIGGRERQTYGTACRQPDGSWQLIN